MYNKITFEEIKQNEEINAYVSKADLSLEAMGLYRPFIWSCRKMCWYSKKNFNSFKFSFSWYRTWTDSSLYARYWKFN